jgi:hypothetical protein
MKVAILEDYQGVALSATNWSEVAAKADHSLPGPIGRPRCGRAS